VKRYAYGSIRKVSTRDYSPWKKPWTACRQTLGRGPQPASVIGYPAFGTVSTPVGSPEAMPSFFCTFPTATEHPTWELWGVKLSPKMAAILEEAFKLMVTRGFPQKWWKFILPRIHISSGCEPTFPTF
jgi:hypothetical protein